MRAKVHVTLKPGVLDPQGKAIAHALEALGFDGVGDVRQGKYIEIDLMDGGGNGSDTGNDTRRGGRGPREGDVREAAGQHGDRELPRRDRLLSVRDICLRRDRT